MQLKGPLRSVILGLFAKLRKATLRFVMPDFKVVHSVHVFFTLKFSGYYKRCTSSCLSVHLSVHMEQLVSYWTVFHEI